MAEAISIAQMAVEVYEKCLSEFGWQTFGLKDQNWECVDPNHGKKTHPSDVVFCYDDPYSKKEVKTFVNTDLKSYGNTTITVDKLKKSIKNLCLAVECANVSQEFRENYLTPGENSEVVGLLFVYNHDQSYDKNFKNVLQNIDFSGIKFRKRRKVFVFGPEDVLLCYNIACDLKMRRGDEKLPRKEDCEFFYPDLVHTKARKARNVAATLEVLLGPYQIIKFKCTGVGGEIRTNFIVYYKGSGDQVDEFLYLIDSFFRYQMLQYANEIIICLPMAGSKAHSSFEQAKNLYVKRLHGLEAIRERLEVVKFEGIGQWLPRFSQNNIGMRL